MKNLGYMKRFDPKWPGAKELSEMVVGDKPDENLRNAIINYLSAGNFLFGWMSFLREEDGTPIGNNDYFTDGVYVWPLYYIYYLRKFDNLQIDTDFIDHVKNNNYVVPTLLKEELVSLERHYDSMSRQFNHKTG